VRPFEAREDGFIERSINIPFEDLRENYFSLYKETEIVIYCYTGANAYNAYRFLELMGFTKLRMLSGGYKTYRAAKDLVGIKQELELV
jgi:rhodanese-related sulfurtransferase